jgi:putative phosphoesterase
MPGGDGARPGTPTARHARVGVVSDTHLPRFGRALPDALMQGLSDPPVDLIVHLGDLTDLLAVRLLEPLAPVRAVAGNNDGPEVQALYPVRDVVELGGARLGLTHGHAGRGHTTHERALSMFAADEVDAILFGHSHAPTCRRLPDGRWLVNPGSPTDRRREPRYSFALIEIADGAVRPVLRFYDERAASAAGASSTARRSRA